MARGRMISKSLSTSEKFARLSEASDGLAEFCQVLYVMLIPHADDFGKLQGDPFTVKHQCFPASPRTTHDFHSALVALHEAELIIWYSVANKRYIQITNFECHQRGLHKRTKSLFPEFPGISGNFLETGGISGNVREIPPEEKGREEKRREEKGTNTSTVKEQQSEPKMFLGWFQTEYAKRRSGAKYFVKWEAHSAIIKRLLKGHPIDRLKKHAILLLTTDEEWSSSTDRGIEVLAGKINWLEERLAAWEKKQISRKAV